MQGQHNYGGLTTLDINRYGSIQQFRDKPTLPSQVYRFDMNTGAVQVVANNFDQANGIAFTGDGKTIYM